MIENSDASACGEYFRTLYKVARTVNSSLDVMQVLETIVLSTAEALNAKACSLRLLAPDGQHLLFGAAHGLHSHYRGKGPVSLDNSGVDRLALSTLAPIHIPDARSDERFQYPDQAREEGIVSVLVVPLMMQDEPIGVMRVYTGTQRVFSEAELALAEAIASLSAMAIENGRLYERLHRDYQAAIGPKEPQLD
jgi:GAF domain-containing protein